MKGKILVTSRSFAKSDKRPLELLTQAGYEVVENPYGAILTKEQMLESVGEAVGIIVGVDPLDREVIDAAPKLRAIAKYGVGVDNIDVEYAKTKGIPVSITRGANTDAVADYAFTMMLTLARRIIEADRRCHAGDWGRVSGGDMCGKTIGILGLGAIGKAVARRARGFDMKILAYDTYWDEAFAAACNIKRTDTEQIFREADFISIHLPLTPETEGLIGKKALSAMKKTAILVNTARGGIVDERALVDALEAGELAGAGLDVFSEEPPADPALYRAKNLILSSHCAAASTGASEMMSLLSAQNILADLEYAE